MKLFPLPNLWSWTFFTLQWKGYFPSPFKWNQTLLLQPSCLFILFYLMEKLLQILRNSRLKTVFPIRWVFCLSPVLFFISPFEVWKIRTLCTFKNCHVVLLKLSAKGPLKERLMLSPGRSRGVVQSRWPLAQFFLLLYLKIHVEFKIYSTINL